MLFSFLLYKENIYNIKFFGDCLGILFAISKLFDDIRAKRVVEF